MRNKIIFLFFFFIFLVTECNKPEILLYNKNKLKNIKIIKLNKIEINTLNFDPFIKKDIENILNFKLSEAGYEVKRNTSVDSNYDAELNFYLSHRKFFKGINDTENITIDLKIKDRFNNTIGEVFFTDVEENDILNTVKLKKYISKMIYKLKKIK